MPDIGQEYTTDGNDGFLVTTACFDTLFTRNYMFISESTASELTEEDYKSLVKAIGEKGLRIRIYMYSISDENYELIRCFLI